MENFFNKIIHKAKEKVVEHKDKAKFAVLAGAISTAPFVAGAQTSKSIDANKNKIEVPTTADSLALYNNNKELIDRMSKTELGIYGSKVITQESSKPLFDSYMGIESDHIKPIKYLNKTYYNGEYTQFNGREDPITHNPIDPITPYIEDKINRNNVRRIYPLITDKDIDEKVKYNQENHSHFLPYNLSQANYQSGNYKKTDPEYMSDFIRPSYISMPIYKKPTGNGLKPNTPTFVPMPTINPTPKLDIKQADLPVSEKINNVPKEKKHEDLMNGWIRTTYYDNNNKPIKVTMSDPYARTTEVVDITPTDNNHPDTIINEALKRWGPIDYSKKDEFTAVTSFGERTSK